MGKQVSIYADEEAEKLLKKLKGIPLSKVFKYGLSLAIARSNALNSLENDIPSEDELKETFRWVPTVEEVEAISNAFEKLPSEDELKETFRCMPTVEEVEAISNAFEKLPSEDELKETFRCMPTVEDIHKLNVELDKTIDRLNQIRELKD